MRTSWGRCPHPSEQTLLFQFQSPRKKSAASFRAAPNLPIAGRRGRSRSKFSRLSFPADKAASLDQEARACSQRAFRKRLPAAHPSASRGRGTARRTTSPPSGNTSPTTKTLGLERLTRGKKYKSRCGLLCIETTWADLLRVARTSSTRDSAVLTAFQLGFCLRVSSSALHAQ
jgi:hypothetical protein